MNFFKEMSFLFCFVFASSHLNSFSLGFARIQHQL
jgi:hypothetical protein